MNCASLHAYSSDWKRCTKMGLNSSLSIQFFTDSTGIISGLNIEATLHLKKEVPFTLKEKFLKSENTACLT